ncbi:MAG: hypothetical protein ABSD48_16815 [Armatimonadota bacterium]|jgi:hypothetical protein
MDGKALEWDLADVLVRDLNSRYHLSLGRVRAPDEDNRSTPAPDCLYSDPKASVAVVMEVKRLYDQARQQAHRHWQRLCRRLNELLTPCVPDGDYYLMITGNARALMDKCEEVAARLAKLKNTKGCDLSCFFGGRVVARRSGVLVGGVSVWHSMPEAPANFERKYVEHLRSANRKLSGWRAQGYETCLLYDARLIDALDSDAVEHFVKAHKHAYRKRDAPTWAPSNLCPLVYDDFSEIDHVVVFGLTGDGVAATSLWKHEPPCHLTRAAFPDQWIIPWDQE